MSSIDVNVKSVATAAYVFGNDLKERGRLAAGIDRNVVMQFDAMPSEFQLRFFEEEEGYSHEN